MKNNRWIFWIVLWVVVLLISLYFLLSPFLSKHNIKATDFINDSALFVGLLSKKDSTDLQDLFFLPDHIRREIGNDASLLFQFCDSLLVAGYKKENSFDLIWICVGSSNSKITRLKDSWFYKEKNGFTLISKNKNLIEEALQNVHGEISFTDVFNLFGNVEGSQWFFRKMPAPDASFSSCACLKSTSWKRYTVKNDTTLRNYQVECIFDTSQTLRTIDNPDSIFLKIPSFVDSFYVSVNLTPDFEKWKSKIPLEITQPWGWFDISGSRTFFTWMSGTSNAKHEFFMSEKPERFINDSIPFYFLLARNVVYWSRDSIMLHRVIAQIVSGNNLLKRRTMSFIMQHVPGSLMDIHIYFGEFPLCKTHATLGLKHFHTQTYFKKSTEEDYFLPPFQFYRSVQHASDSYILLQGKDGFVYIFSPANKYLIKTTSSLSKIYDANVFISPTSEKLFVFLSENELLYVRYDGKSTIPGKLKLPDAKPRSFAAVYLENPPGWRLVFVSRQKEILNIQLSGIPSQGWRAGSYAFSDNVRVAGNAGYYFIKDQNHLYILNRTGKEVHKKKIYSNLYFSGDSTWWIGDKMDVFLFHGGKIQKHTVHGSFDDEFEFLYASNDGVVFLNQENVLITGDLVKWKKISLPFARRDIKKILLLKIQAGWQGLVLLKSGKLSTLRLSENQQDFEVSEVPGLYDDMGYDNYQWWGVLSSENLLRFFKSGA